MQISYIYSRNHRPNLAKRSVTPPKNGISWIFAKAGLGQKGILSEHSFLHVARFSMTLAICAPSPAVHALTQTKTFWTILFGFKKKFNTWRGRSCNPWVNLLRNWMCQSNTPVAEFQKVGSHHCRSNLLTFGPLGIVTLWGLAWLLSCSFLSCLLPLARFGIIRLGFSRSYGRRLHGP